MFKKILIANRGEIAVRIIRTCREMGIRTVAIYSTADQEALHVLLADEAYCIGPVTSKESYLNMTNILSLAVITGCDGIHPGYGFMSEKSEFAEICSSCGIKFIGPSSHAIETMGAKAKARETMQKAGVPIVPGSDGIIENLKEALSIADACGYPVIVKASSGGGGKGMRIAWNNKELEKAITMAQQEAETAFGDSSVYIEKYLEEPRHIEIQILADSHGNVLHLGERDCSIQRRHQKLIEEAPSPVIDQNVREQMGQAAVEAARAVDYVTAGTVEFLLDKHGNFFFMEMNTRIQVEHPVTEMITGVDLIREQIIAAAGERLSLNQSDVVFNGWSIECRINAEDPQKKFMPSPGKITDYIAPGGYGVRVDSAAYQGYIITPYYDSMIAKLIVHAKNRQQAIARMKRALTEFRIDGVKTTIPFHLALLEHPQFVAGDFNTKFLEINQIM